MNRGCGPFGIAWPDPVNPPFRHDARTLDNSNNHHHPTIGNHLKPCLLRMTIEQRPKVKVKIRNRPLLLVVGTACLVVLRKGNTPQWFLPQTVATFLNAPISYQHPLMIYSSEGVVVAGPLQSYGGRQAIESSVTLSDCLYLGHLGYMEFQSVPIVSPLCNWVGALGHQRIRPTRSVSLEVDPWLLWLAAALHAEFHSS